MKRASALLVAIVLAAMLLDPLAAHALRPKLQPWARAFSGKQTIGVVTSRKVVALTMDDFRAVGSTVTVDALAANGLRATLFCIASSVDTASAEYAVARGFELGNHGWWHVSLASMSSVEASRQIGLANDHLHDMTGVWPVWYRSPFLATGLNGMARVAAQNMLYAHPALNTKDWVSGTTPAQVVASVASGLRPGAVISVHQQAATNDALVGIGKLLRQRGYETLTMSELATVGPPATTVSQLWKSPTALSSPIVVGKATSRKLARLQGRVSPGRSTTVRVYVSRRVGQKYRPYRAYAVRTRGSGTWTLNSRLPKGSYRARTATSVETMYRAGVSWWSLFKVR